VPTGLGEGKVNCQGAKDAKGTPREGWGRRKRLGGLLGALGALAVDLAA